VYRLRGQAAAARPCDPATLAAMSDAGKPAPSWAEEVLTRLTARTWLDRLRAQRACLRAAVPGRSPQPGRYRHLIVQTAEYVLRSAIDGNVSGADSNEALQAAFPEWFGRSGRAENISHKRLSRARRDVRDLLQVIVSRDELLP